MTNTLHSYRPDIDGLRAIAVLSVLFYHAFPTLLPGGFIGVDIFFVISGFLITNIVQKEIINHSFSIKNFYVRRIKRIFPALILVLLATY
jgi:peptidoglycan/LPS O-acetylase OafA/YrhL